MKYYEFKFKSGSYKTFDGFGNKLINFFIPFFIFGIIVMVFYETPISNYWWFSIAVKILFFVCFVIAVLLVNRYKEKPKGVFLYDNYFDINRQSISRGHTFKMNYRINISNIKCCSIEKNDDSNSGLLLYHLMGGTGDHFVKVNTNDDEVFCFFIENQEDFVENVISRANEYRRKNGLEEI